MNLFWRRFVYLNFFGVFFITAFLLLFYLQGYRYNSANHRVEKTGAIMADSLPTQAHIYLNDQLYNEQTPVTIQSLTPQDYNVRLQIDGFQTWQKKLTVQGSKVTFTGQVRLWPKNYQAETITTGQINQSLLSPNKENLLYQINNGLSAGLWLLNLSSGQAALLTRPAAVSFKYLEWSPSSRQILTLQNDSSQKNWKIFNISDNSWHNLTLPSDLKPLKMHWGDSENQLYFSTDQEVYSFNVSNNSYSLIWREPVKDFRLHDGLIFALSLNNAPALSLKTLDINNLKVMLFANPPTLSTNVDFGEACDTWLPLLDQDRHTLYLLHSPLTELNPIRQLPEVTALDWYQEKNQLLLTNNFEIWNYQIKEDRLSLLLRLASPFTLSRYFNNEPYLIVASANELWAMELDTRDTQQRWLLSTFKKPIQNLYFDGSNRHIIVKTDDGLFRFIVNPNEPNVNRRLISWP